MLLMDRHFRQKGVELGKITQLDRLAYVGSTAMGALTYEPDLSEGNGLSLLDMARISEDAEKIYQGEAYEVLPELAAIGTSPGGARPKALVGINGCQMITGERNLPEGYEAWIIKFHTTSDKKCEEGMIEAAYAEMAKLCGITMPETQLFHVNGKQFFGIKRFDRDNNNRTHVHSLAGLVNADFRRFDFDYESLFKVTQLLTKDRCSIEQTYRQMVFNLLAVNRDDHSKNFSFLMDGSGRWTLSPAYDMTFNMGVNGEQSMSVSGYGKNVPEKVLFALADKHEIDDEMVR